MSTQLELPVDDVLGDWRARLAPPNVLAACREQLRRADETERRSWQHCEVAGVRYEPARCVRVAYVLLGDPQTPAHRRWPEGQIVYFRAPVREPLSRRGERLSLDGHEVESYCFPNDRRLRGIRKFAGKSAIIHKWQAWIDSSGDDFRIDGDTVQRLLVRYVPEQKWIVRLRAEGIDRSGSCTKRRIAVRAASASGCAALARAHQTFAEFARQAGNLFVVPAVVGCDTKQGLLGVEWIRGDSLVEALRSLPAQKTLERVAAILHTLHSAQASSLPVQTMEDVNERVQQAVDDLSKARPDLRPRLASLAREFQALARTIHAADPATLHNDFHWNQLQIKGNRYALLDLERICCGDPLIDVANFVTQLRLLGVRPELDVEPMTAEVWARTFLIAWERRTARPVVADRLRVYSVLSRLEFARGMMRHARSGWPILAEHCVAGAESDLGMPAGKVVTP
ncbi:MAG: aminoglycoside phosphotransferase family protein [Ralstonia sp.]|nr:MAG: aminoglycoside phosphotransferase family protein [Ralstonia sp.]